MRIRVRPTALGIKGLLFFVLITLAYLAAPYSNLFFLLLTCLVALAGLGIVWSAANLRRVSGSILETEACAADVEGNLHLTLHSTAPGALQVQCHVRLDAGWVHSISIPLIQGAVSAHGRLPALPRGIHRLREARLASSFPLGIVQWSKTIRAPQELVVFPTPLPMDRGTNRSAILETVCGQLPNRGHGSQPVGLRPFRDGDERRAVHWRASARRNEMVVREVEDDGREGLEVCLDRRTEDGLFERGLSLITTLLLIARDNKEAFTLHSQGHSATYGPGNSPYLEGLRWLAATQLMSAHEEAPPAASSTALQIPAQLSQVGGAS